MAHKNSSTKNLLGYILIVIATISLYRIWKLKHEKKADTPPAPAVKK